MIELTNINAPIVFKGGLVLKMMLLENNIGTVRYTTDLDGNWIENNNIDQMKEIITRAVKNIRPDYTVTISRLPSEKSSAGFLILDEHQQKFTKIDLDVKDNPFYVEYLIEESVIRCASFEKIIADKLNALSDKKVFRRSKDLLDIYLLSEEENIDFTKVLEVLKKDNRNIGSFETLLNNLPAMEHAYNKLKGIENKPPFYIVWNKVSIIIEDFQKYLDNENYLKAEQNNDLEL